MLASRKPKKKLSKNLLQMKFMQKHKEEILREQQEEEYKNKLNEEHWYLDNVIEEDLKDAAETEPSFVVCEDLLPIGRMSFKNFNPSVEKIYNELLRKRNLRIQGLKEDEESISDNEMAQRYESLVDTVLKKFKRKRKNEDGYSEKEQVFTSKKHKKMFLKPKLE